MTDNNADVFEVDLLLKGNAVQQWLDFLGRLFVMRNQDL